MISTIISEIMMALFLLYNGALKTALTFEWSTMAFPFLNPSVNFPQLLTGTGAIPPLGWVPSAFLSNNLEANSYAMYSQNLMDIAVNLNIIFLDYIVVPIMSIIIILGALEYLLKFQIYKKEDLGQILPKMFLGIVLAYSSVYFADLIMMVSGAFYKFLYYIDFTPSQIPGGSILLHPNLVGIWNLGGWPILNTQWYQFLQDNGLVIFLFNLALFALIFTLVVVLIIRIIWILVTITLLPIASLLLIFKHTENFGKKVWITFLERTFEIFLIGIPLIFLNYLSDPVFSLGILVVAISMPSFIGTVGKALGNPNSGYVVARGINTIVSNDAISGFVSPENSGDSGKIFDLVGTLAM
ncbi:MAG: hypothetical protein ACP5RY_03040 [Thermoplasmata archaeon]